LLTDLRDVLLYQCMSNIVIEYYSEKQYGTDRDYVSNCSDAQIISQLTGQKTINSNIRELIHDLSRGIISFKQILPPKKD